jgi:hypothetical protein
MNDGDGRESLPKHILPAAGTMLGICTTLIGLVKVVEPTVGASRVDEFASLTALLFLCSALVSYASLRRSGPASQRLEQAADLSFLLGLVSLAAVSVLFAYEVI